MTEAYQAGKLKFPGISAPFERPDRFNQLKKSLYSKKWVVHMKQAIDRPEYVLEYLGRYTHRVAISNHRIVSLRQIKPCIARSRRLSLSGGF
ncbi:MAG: transposase [Deltaproteobacteria bacterium]|nr:transposase [Deltaproteobacteria bacterium]